MIESRLQVPELSKTRLYIYRRPLHPELFGIFLETKLAMARYEAQIWLLGLGHAVSFHVASDTITELISADSKHLPAKGRVEAVSLAGTHEFQYSLGEAIYYVVNSHVERMSEPVFERVYDEMTQFGEKHGLFMRFEQWVSEDGVAPFSMIDYTHKPTELGIFAYHLFPAEKLMLSTQSIFSLAPISRMPGSPGQSRNRTRR